MTTYNTITNSWDELEVTHDDIRAAIGKNATITTTSNGLIIFKDELTPTQKLAVENLLKNKRA